MFSFDFCAVGHCVSSHPNVRARFSLRACLLTTDTAFFLRQKTRWDIFNVCKFGGGHLSFAAMWWWTLDEAFRYDSCGELWTWTCLKIWRVTGECVLQQGCFCQGPEFWRPCRALKSSGSGRNLKGSKVPKLQVSGFQGLTPSKVPSLGSQWVFSMQNSRFQHLSSRVCRSKTSCRHLRFLFWPCRTRHQTTFEPPTKHFSWERHLAERKPPNPKNKTSQKYQRNHTQHPLTSSRVAGVTLTGDDPVSGCDTFAVDHTYKHQRVDNFLPEGEFPPRRGGAALPCLRQIFSNWSESSLWCRFSLVAGK